jgi:hypothetical protein
MKPRDIFGIAIRIFGFWFLTQSGYWGYWALVKSANPDAGNQHISVQEDIASAILYVLLTILTIGGARVWIWLAYGDGPKLPDAAANSLSTAGKPDEP